VDLSATMTQVHFEVTSSRVCSGAEQVLVLMQPRWTMTHNESRQARELLLEREPEGVLSPRWQSSFR